MIRRCVVRARTRRLLPSVFTPNLRWISFISEKGSAPSRGLYTATMSMEGSSGNKTSGTDVAVATPPAFTDKTLDSKSSSRATAEEIVKATEVFQSSWDFLLAKYGGCV